MMAQKLPVKFTFRRIERSLDVPSDKPAVITTTRDKVPIDDAYKEFFASLFKIKDKDVQRRVLQAVNGQIVTCANCEKKTQNNSSTFTQTLTKDFEFLEKVNSSPKRNGAISQTTTTKSNAECFILNKIQLGRAKRKFEPYVVKAEREKCIIPNNKMSSLRYNHEPDSLLNKIRRPNPKTENPITRTICTDLSITEKLLLDNLDDQSMPPNAFFNFGPNEPQTKINDFFLVTRMEQDMRTAALSNEEGLYTIHIATIEGDLFRLRRLMVIYKYNKLDINVRSMDEKKETPLHFAMSCVKNARNNEIIDLLYDNGADVLATNDIGDTVLHLAAETIQDYNVITKLLSKISLDDLSKQNDKSQTILHVAAANKNRTFVKSILNFIDEKLNILSIGSDIIFNEAGEYFKQLDELHLNYVKTFISENFKKPTINATKAKILNQQDGRSGKTAVFLSLDSEDQSTCLMLLSHFADTRIPDFSNTTCAFYSSEVLKNRIVAQAIYNADSMHNAVVFKTLKQTEKTRSVETRKRWPSNVNENYDDDSDIMSKVAKVLS